MKSRPKQIFAIKCLTLHGGNDVRPEVHAVIGANDQPAAQTAAITIISAAMKDISHSVRGIIRVKGTKASVWMEGDGTFKVAERHYKTQAIPL